MTNNEHPITPPPEMVQQLADGPGTWLEKIIKAYQTGADQELKGCCEYIGGEGKWFANPEHRLRELRVARRPKPLSDKQEALSALEQIDGWAVANMSNLAIHDDLVKGVGTIRRALESLPS